MRYKAIIQEAGARGNFFAPDDIYYSFDSVRDDFEDERVDRDHYYDDLFIEDDDSDINCFFNISAQTREILSTIFIVRNDHPLYNFNIILDTEATAANPILNKHSQYKSLEEIATIQLKKECRV